MSMYDIPSEARGDLESEFESGEHLLWAGKPEPKRAVRGEWGLFVFAIPWTVFALFWESMALGIGSLSHGNAPMGFSIVFPLFGLPFIAVGVAMLSAPFRAMRNARTTIYAISDRRIVIIERNRGGRHVQSYGAPQIRELERTERNDGSGDLVFSRKTNVSGYSTQYGTRTMSTTPIGFWGIPNVREVEQLIRKTFLDGHETEARRYDSYEDQPVANVRLR